MRKWLVILLILLLAIPGFGQSGTSVWAFALTLSVLIQLNWFCESIFDGPAIFKATPYCADVKSFLLGPIRQAHSSIFKCNQAIVSSIAGLLRIISPSTIVQPIMPIIIRKTVESFIFGPFSHISKEVCKNQPPLANFYTTSTIVMILVIIWISTSLNHVIPSLISSIVITSFAHSVFAHLFSPKTAAGLRQTFFQAKYRDDLSLSTLTGALPMWMKVSRLSVANHRQSSKNLPCGIFKIYRFIGTITSSHAAFSSSESGLIRPVRLLQQSLGLI